MVSPIKLNWVDRTIGYFNPARGLKRAQSRMALAAYSDSGYIVPGSSRKSVKGWKAGLNSPARDIDNKFDGLKAASRDLFMNSAVAVSIFRRNRLNVVGPGLQVQPMVDRDFLKISDMQADDLNEQLTREFDLFANSFECDYQGQVVFGEQQGLLLCASLINGDVFFALPMVEPKRRDWPFETTVKLIDGDLIRTPSVNYLDSLNSTNAKIRSGVEFDADNRLDAYWVASEYPNEAALEKFERIPIYNELGERQIFQVADFERIGQRRALPLLAPVTSLLKMITRNSENELMASTVAALFTVLVRDANNTGARLQEPYLPSQTVGGGGSLGPDATAEEKTEGNEFDLELGPGSVYYLPEGTDISIAESRRGRNEYEPFFKAMATEVSAACNLPFDVVMLSFNRSYSALRGAILEASKEWKTRRSQLCTRFCQPVYEAVIAESVAKGRLRMPGFFSDLRYRQAYCRSRWVGLGSGQIDPLKEALAAELKIKCALSTHEEEYQSDKGGRWRPTVERLAREKELIDQYGLTPVDEGGQSQEGIRARIASQGEIE